VAGNKTVVEVDGRTLKLSNLDKVLYPETGFTKGEVIDYYTRIAPTMLAHVGDRHRAQQAETKADQGNCQE